MVEMVSEARGFLATWHRSGEPPPILLPSSLESASKARAPLAVATLTSAAVEGEVTRQWGPRKVSVASATSPSRELAAELRR